MWIENNPFGMKQIIFAAFFSFSLVICKENREDSTREKRDYGTQHYSIQNHYDSNNYPSNSYNPENQPLKCNTPPKCLPLSAIPNQGDQVTTNRSWFSIPLTFYQTGGSCWGYSLFANMFLGREVRLEHELEEMCLTSYFSSIGLSYVDGYGRQFAQDYVQNPNDAGQTGTTVPGSGTEGTDLSLQNVEVDYLILTNSKSFLLYYRCVDNRYADYALFTTTPFVERADAVQVIDTIRAMGFDYKEIRFLPCEHPRYPSPVNNYPYNTCGNNYGLPDTYHYAPIY